MKRDRSFVGSARSSRSNCWSRLVLLWAVMFSLHSATTAQDTSTAENSSAGNKGTLAAADLKRGLVGYYPFDEDASDQSGNMNHGAAHGVVAYEKGKVGNALQLLGNEDRGFIFIKDSPSLTFERETTFACWFLINDGIGQTGENFSAGLTEKAHQVLVAKHGDIAGFSLLSLGEGTLHRQISVIAQNGSTSEVGATFPPDKPVGKWQHAATVADDNGVRLYLNGTLVSAVRGTFNFDRINNCNIFVGINGPAESDSDPTRFLWFPLNGAIDELRVYNRALSHAEVRLLAAEDKAEGREPGEQPSLLANNFPEYSPDQATGLPDTPNCHNDASTAWASEMPDGPAEWLMLEYARPVKPKAVVLYEASNGGAVSGLTVFDSDGNEVEVWTGRTQRTAARGTIVASVLKFSVPFETSKIRIKLTPDSCPGWNQIDAVGLRDVSGQIQWATKATASSTRAAVPAE